MFCTIIQNLRNDINKLNDKMYIHSNHVHICNRTQRKQWLENIILATGIMLQLKDCHAKILYYQNLCLRWDYLHELLTNTVSDWSIKMQINMTKLVLKEILPTKMHK